MPGKSAHSHCYDNFEVRELLNLWRESLHRGALSNRINEGLDIKLIRVVQTAIITLDSIAAAALCAIAIR